MSQTLEPPNTFQPCPKCGKVDYSVGVFDGVIKTIACDCGYQMPDVAIAGNEVPFELPRLRLKSQVERDELKAENERLRAELESLREAERWIPVGERLPGEEWETVSKNVLIGREGSNYLTVGYYSRNDRSWHFTNGNICSSITHWRHLPAAPHK